MNEQKDFSPDRNCWTTCQVYFDDEGEPSLWRRIPDTHRVLSVDLLERLVEENVYYASKKELQSIINNKEQS